MMSAMEVYVLAMQAARGLHRAHLYDQEGRATHVVADVQPGQFLLFHRNHRIMEEGGSREEDGSTLADDDVGLVARVTTTAVRENADVPILQIQDFNRGRYQTRRYDNATITAITCPFRTCNVRHWGSTYRSPEEYVVPSWDGKGGDCGDQTEAIDVYALGGVFYYLLSGGRKPWYYVAEYDETIRRILGGETSKLPEELLLEEEMLAEGELGRDMNGRSGGEGGKKKKKKGGADAPWAHLTQWRERSTHPAVLALKEVMMDCWQYEPGDRPSSLQVVRMLEEKWRNELSMMS